MTRFGRAPASMLCNRLITAIVGDGWYADAGRTRYHQTRHMYVPQGAYL